ncbi:alpha/beta hydrolase [Sphingopyxis sp. BSNA05]|uniref:alpha/beta hydrolase n=1 Tax=Sphingopyxis sp. BSNA05 TaxID=1236614 RepID=UPI001566D24F|nr:alpha/beta hydrolase [Sphingopyxis sp. BSNA05]
MMATALVLVMLSGCAEPVEQTQPDETEEAAQVDAIVLQPDGISSGEGQRFSYGTDKSTVTAMLEEYGPVHQNSNEECGAGPMESATSAATGLTANFQDGRLVGWYFDGDGKAVRTARNVSVGSTRGELEAAMPIEMQPDSTLGIEFFSGSGEDGFIGGFLSDNGATATIDSLYSGTNCFSADRWCSIFGGRYDQFTGAPAICHCPAFEVEELFAETRPGRKIYRPGSCPGPASPVRWLRKHCDIEKSEIDGQPLYRLRPKENGTSLHIFYLHGGGYAFNIVSLHWHFIKKLIRKTGASVTVPIYPLSPENKWDRSYAMVMEAFRQAVSRHGAENIVVMGDSAGGGFSLGLSQMLRDEGKELPAKLVLLSPYLDQTAADATQAELEKTDVLISVEGIRRLGSWWMREGEDPAMFPASPLFAPLDRLPPMLVFAGTDEVLLADSLRLKQKGDECGANIELKLYDRMQHVWMLLPIPEAKKALNEITGFLLSSKS